MKYWITKYALTQGIFEIEGLVEADIPKVCTRIKESVGPPEHYHKPYWYESRTAAVMHARKQRTQRIAALKKQITKLEGMKF